EGSTAEPQQRCRYEDRYTLSAGHAEPPCVHVDASLSHSNARSIIRRSLRRKATVAVNQERVLMSRPAAFLATLLAIALLETTTWAQAPREVVVVGMEAEPPGLDPGQALGLHTLRVTAEIFETLVATPDDSTDVIPGLAESWTTSSDGLTWTFKLRKGVRFHDGTPLDAAAVKF